MTAETLHENPPTAPAAVNVHPAIKEAAVGTGTGKEPQTIAEALTTATSGFQAEWEAAYRASPTNFHEPGKCCDCGGVLPTPFVLELSGVLTIPFIRCNACIKTKLEQQKEEEEKAFAATIVGWCPPEFGSPWDATKATPIGVGLYKEVFKRFSFSTRKGLIIFGPSGACKTRVTWELMKHMHKTSSDEFRFLFLDSFEIATKGIPEEAYKTPLLVIDDLGNEPLGPKNEKALLHLIRRRCDWHKPIIVTTQLSATDLKKQFFSGHTGEAAIRRLRERSELISVGGIAAGGVK